MLALSMLLARRLGTDGFEVYAVAAEVFVLAVHVAPLGIEKYALRLLPVLLDRQDWAAARGYPRFGMRHTVLGALLLGGLITTWALWLRDLSTVRRATLATAMSVPARTLVHFGVEC